MRAQVDTKFSRGFFLSEESIKKIEDIASKRLAAADYEQSFDARRVDDAVISYVDSADLIAHEENSKRNLVKSLEFKAKSTAGALEINFERGEKTPLKIESEHRDTALLLSADIKEYLKSEVLIRRFYYLNTLISNKLTFPVFYMISIIPVLLMSTLLRQPKNIDLRKATVDQKLNYLIDASHSAAEAITLPNYWFGLFLIIILLLVVFSSPLVYPAYTFYWGKEISRYDTAKSVRGKVFWVVFIGIIVGVIGSLLAGWVQPGV